MDIWLAAQKLIVSRVRECLEDGFDPNTEDERGSTLLIKLCRNTHFAHFFEIYKIIKVHFRFCNCIMPLHHLLFQ